MNIPIKTVALSITEYNVPKTENIMDGNMVQMKIPDWKRKIGKE